MSIKAKRELYLSRYTDHELSQAKSCLKQVVDGYIKGESSVHLNLTMETVSSDRIMKVIIKYFTYSGIDFTYSYSKFHLYQLKINFK